MKPIRTPQSTRFGRILDGILLSLKQEKWTRLRSVNETQRSDISRGDIQEQNDKTRQRGLKQAVRLEKAQMDLRLDGSVGLQDILENNLQDAAA